LRQGEDLIEHILPITRLQITLTNHDWSVVLRQELQSGGKRKGPVQSPSKLAENLLQTTVVVFDGTDG
jgi:hypothetical protein